MNKTPKINRLFLVTVIWILLSGIFSGIYPVCSFDGCDAADAFEPASVFDAGYWIYDHKQGRSEKVDAI